MRSRRCSLGPWIGSCRCLRTTVARRALGPPLRRRELLVRGAGAWAATSAVLAWPVRAPAGMAPSASAGPRPARTASIAPSTAGCAAATGAVCGEDPFGRPTARCDPEEATDQRCFSLSQTTTTAGGAIALSRRRALLRLRVCAPRRESLQLRRRFLRRRRDLQLRASTSALPASATAAPTCSPASGVAGTNVVTRRRSAAAGSDSTNRKGWGRGTGSAAAAEASVPASSTPTGAPTTAAGCNKPCERGELCYRGKCRKRCPPGRRQCGRTCGNPRTEACCSGRLIAREDMLYDEENCGACGSACPDEPRYQCCPKRGKGACVNTDTDGEHCGGCGQFCSGLPGAPDDRGCECQQRRMRTPVRLRHRGVHDLPLHLIRPAVGGFKSTLDMDQRRSGEVGLCAKRPQRLWPEQHRHRRSVPGRFWCPYPHPSAGIQRHTSGSVDAW